MRKKYYSKTFRIEPETYKRIRAARLKTKGRFGVSWDTFFNELLDLAGLDKPNDTKQ